MSDQALAEDRLWGVEDASYYLGVPVQTLYSWRGQGVGPPGRRVGGRLRYVGASRTGSPDFDGRRVMRPSVWGSTATSSTGRRAQRLAVVTIGLLRAATADQAKRADAWRRAT